MPADLPKRPLKNTCFTAVVIFLILAPKNHEPGTTFGNADNISGRKFPRRSSRPSLAVVDRKLLLEIYSR
jgi:hypothetical protein